MFALPVDIHFDGDEIFVQGSNHAGILEGIVLHSLAGTAPFGIKMEKNFFLLKFSTRHPFRVRLPFNSFGKCGVM